MWDLTQAREAWSFVKGSQDIQSKLLIIIEKQGKEIANAELELARQVRMDKRNKISEYWNKRRLDAQMEAVRGGISILNLSTDWLEWMEVETDDHREMDMMMDMTGAVLDMTRISIAEEELILEELMTTLAPAVETMNTSGAGGQKWSEGEELMEDTIWKG